MAESPWPWSELGISPTPDKQAIRDAYAAQRAGLDLSMRISAFAKLTEAREKALFLASEMQREANRTGRIADPVPMVPNRMKTARNEVVEAADLPFTPEVGESAPEPEPEPEPASEEVPVELAEADPAISSCEPEPHDASSQDAEPACKPPNPYGVPSYESGEPTPFFQRYSFQKYRVWWLAGLLLLVSLFSGTDDSSRPAPVPRGVDYDRPQIQIPARELLPAQSDRAELMVDTLFGEDLTWQDIEEFDPGMAQEFAYRMQLDPGSFGEAQAFVRTEILRVRAVAPREDRIAIAELHRVWLRTAQPLAGGACREVTGATFNDGVPQLSSIDAEQERQLVRKLFTDGTFSRQRAVFESGGIPDWAYAEAAAASGLAESGIRASLGSYTHPQRCEASIAVLDALLRRRDEVPDAAFAAL